MNATGVLVVQMGGPAKPSEVRPFIEAILSDPDMVHLPGNGPIRTVFARAVSILRAPAVRRRYAAIGGSSPLWETTLQQATALQKELEARGRAVPVEAALRHGKPSIEAAVERLGATGVERIVMLGMFPQFSFSTTGSAERELRRVARHTGLEVEVIREWYDHPSFVEAVACRVLDAVGPCDPERLVLFFAAHGLPSRSVRMGDPYAEQVEATVRLVRRRLGDLGVGYAQAVLGYQSRVGPGRWTEPDCMRLAGEMRLPPGAVVVIVPVSFVAENLETLWDLDEVLRGELVAKGVGEVRRAEVLGTMDDVGGVLADVVEARL